MKTLTFLLMCLSITTFASNKSLILNWPDHSTLELTEQEIIYLLEDNASYEYGSGDDGIQCETSFDDFEVISFNSSEIEIKFNMSYESKHGCWYYDLWSCQSTLLIKNNTVNWRDIKSFCSI